MENNIKEAIGTTLAAPTKEEAPKHPVYFTKRELEELEDLLYEKASILENMAEFRAYKKDHAQARHLEGKSIRMEKLAIRVAVVLDSAVAKGGK